jgi:hypothetical protein
MYAFGVVALLLAEATVASGYLFTTATSRRNL